MDEPGPTPLASYLADRDEPCPACRYNLRGATGVKCPECGHPLALSIARPAGRSSVLLLLVLLGWALVSGGVYGAKSVRAAYDEAATSMRWLMGPTSGSLIVNGRSFPLPSTRSAVTVRAGSGVVSSGQFFFNSSSTASPARDWSQVRWQTWAMMGAWTALALAAAAILVIVVLRRGRIGREGPSRGLLTAAAIVFAIGAAGQVYTIVKDLVG